MSDERPEALLKSALEKIVYFEARSRQLENDVASARGELEQLRQELAAAGQREIELRRTVAGYEVELARAHRERQEVARTNEALRAERVALLDQIIEASQIHSSDRPEDGDNAFDLASFIAQLRSEVMNAQRGHSAFSRDPSDKVVLPRFAGARAEALAKPTGSGQDGQLRREGLGGRDTDFRPGQR